MSKMYCSIFVILVLLCITSSSFRIPFNFIDNSISSSSISLTRRNIHLNAVTDMRIVAEEMKSNKINIDKPLESSSSSSSPLSPPISPISPLLDTTNKFISAWRNGLQGNQIDLKEIIDKKIKWENPFVTNSNELMEGLSQFSSFFSEPSLTVFNIKLSETNINQVEISYYLSFWYPMAWKPRIIIPSTAIITLNNEQNKVISVHEKWEISMGEVFTKQLLPRFWDIWHCFCSPSPEYPPIKTISKVIYINVNYVCMHSFFMYAYRYIRYIDICLITV